VLARLSDDPHERAVAEAAERRLHALGVRTRAPLPAGPLACLPREPEAPVQIATLGGFRILRHGQPVPSSAWQSKKARDLLKLLIARRGRRTPRDVLMEALWPEDDPAKVANRLSVALATVRAVLDPEKLFASDYFVVADKQAVGLDFAHLAVDVETFLAQARAALRAETEGRAQARAMLEAAEAVDTGDFLEEDLYEDWAAATREEARAVYLAVARALARAAEAAGDDDAAVRYHLRILERDRYDEAAHLELVAALERAGRHGEARRYYRAYVAQLQELELEPATFPGETRTARP
jgi:DNA-binding SARP family transcriptional activator